jgi:hypothetical protein
LVLLVADDRDAFEGPSSLNAVLRSIAHVHFGLGREMEVDFVDPDLADLEVSAA